MKKCGGESIPSTPDDLKKCLQKAGDS